MVNQNLEKKQIDLISESICVYQTCGECLELYKQGQLGFLRIEEFVDDRGKSCLYRLKQMCHDLFRNADEAGYKEKFYDITVGYIFHEAMILRENLYQLEYYTPQHNTLINSTELTPLEKRVIHEFDTLISKAEQRLREGLKEIKRLLKELMTQVKDLIKLYRNNYLLSRFILENEGALIKIYGRKAFLNLLNDMYQDGRRTLVLKAAISYLDSEYYDIARKLLVRVISQDKQNPRVRFFFLYTSAFTFYFRNRFSRALACAAEALSIHQDNGETEPYQESLKRLISDASKEVKRATRAKEVSHAHL